MLTVEERGLVAAHRPVKPVRGAPPLFRRHPAKHRNLFRAGFFIRQHESNVAIARFTASEIANTAFVRQIMRSTMNKRFYITTAIDYVNGQPHLGHAYEKIVADVIARSRRSLGQEVFFLTGLDEHGQKVQQAAIAEGKTPQAYCDKLAADWQAFAKKLELTNDDFVRTTEPRHKAIVQAGLAKVFQTGKIYKQTYSGFYSTKEETFLTDKDRRPDGTFDPSYGEVIELKEDNYFFKLGEQQQWLIDYLEANPSFVQPDYRRNEVLGFLKNNQLEDLCISRPAARLNWGIPLPFDNDFVTYVWFDALVNYISIPAAHGDATVLSALNSEPTPKRHRATPNSNSNCGPPTFTSSARTF